MQCYHTLTLCSLWSASTRLKFNLPKIFHNNSLSSLTMETLDLKAQKKERKKVLRDAMMVWIY